MRLTPTRRVVVLAAQVVVLTLTTAPLVDGVRAASDEANENAEGEEQVAIRVTNGRLHVTARTEVGRVVGLAYATDAESLEWTVLQDTVAVATEGGVAQIQVDLDAYADQEIAVAVVTAADGEFERDLRATEAAEIVLFDGDAYGETEVEWDDKGGIGGVALKGRSYEVSAKAVSPVDAAKGIAVSLKGVTELPDVELESGPRGRGR